MSALQARPYQDRMITDIRRAVQQGKRRILVVLPTGGGKSVVAASIMQLTAAKGNESIFFASQRELITQIGNQLAKIDVPSRTIMAGVKEADGFEDRVDVLCSLVARDTLWQRAFKRNKMELPKADVMQIDECVTGDAIVETRDRGPQQLKDIVVGDFVLSSKNSNDCWRLVTATYDKGYRDTVIVRLGKMSIRCTPEHEIKVLRDGRVRGWQEALSLMPGDRVFVSDYIFGPGLATVTGTERSTPERVYDITVEDTHCFYANGILVHNCHQVGCPTYVSIMEAYEESIIIGWTATPCRSDNRPLGLWFDTMVQGATYKELQDGGYLVPVKVIAPDRPDLQGCKVSRGDYAKGDLQKRMNRDEMVGNIVKEWLRHAQGRSTVLFAAGVDHSIHCRDIFRKEGITAEHIDGKMPTEERDEIMARARDGQIRVVCNYGVLHTGVDVPQWKVMICARPTKSFGLFRQMAGRIQRPYAGHDACLILDHSDNTLHFGFPDEDVEWEIDGDGDQAKKHMERKKHEPGEKGSDPYACEKCHTLYRGYACPVCGHKPEKKGNEIKMSSGELKELERARANRKASPMDKQKHWDKCMGIAIQKGMKIGAAAHMYKEHFGVFPASSVQNVPRSSQWKMTAKDFYMQVVRPEKKAAEREIQTSLLW